MEEVLIDLYNRAQTKGYKKSIEDGNQIIMSTHNYLFMQAFPDNILSVENTKYMTLDNFSKSQKKPEVMITKRKDKVIKKEFCKMGLACKCERYNRNCENHVEYGNRKRTRR